MWGGDLGGGFFKKRSGGGPPPVGTLLYWFSPTAGVTLDGSNGVVSVASQVLGGPTMGQATMAARPGITTFGDNSANIFDYTVGTSPCLSFTLPATSAQFTVAILVVPGTQTSTMAIGGTVTTTKAPLLQWGTSAATRFSIAQNNAATVVQGSTAVTSGSATVIAMNYDGTTLRAIQGTGGSAIRGSAAASGFALTSGDTFYLGCSPTKTSFNGQIGDIKVWYGATNSSSSDLIIQFYTDMQDQYGF